MKRVRQEATFGEFLFILVPAGCPLALLPLLALFEFISYLARNSISLGLRLGDFIMAAHKLLNILAGFTYNIITSGIIIFCFGIDIFSIYYGFLVPGVGSCASSSSGVRSSCFRLLARWIRLGLKMNLMMNSTVMYYSSLSNKNNNQDVELNPW